MPDVLFIVNYHIITIYTQALYCIFLSQQGEAFSAETGDKLPIFTVRKVKWLLNIIKLTFFTV